MLYMKGVCTLNTNDLKGTVFNRVITPSEKQAYKNLKEYDGGIYKIKNYKIYLYYLMKLMNI